MQILGFFALGGGVVWGGGGVVVVDFTLSAIGVGLKGLIAATAAAGSASVEAVRNIESLKESNKRGTSLRDLRRSLGPKYTCVASLNFFLISIRLYL